MTKHVENLIHVNTATLNELSAVPGIGPALASRISDGRPYTKLEDLIKVKGIGPKSLAPLLPYLTAESISEQEMPVIVEEDLPAKEPKIGISKAAVEEKTPLSTSLSISTLLPVFVVLGVAAVVMIILQSLKSKKEEND